LLDRIVRGRAWIPLLGMLLAGIVAMQVEVLKLGAGIGRSIENGSALQSRNELLRASVASLADDQRIERLAAGMGMVMPEPAAISFLSAHPADAGRAVSNSHAPASATFLTALAALNAASAVSGPPSTATSSTTTGTTVPSASPSASAPPSQATTPATATPSQGATTTPTGTAVRA